MELKSRQAYIINLILGSQNGCSIKEIADKLSITRRTFYYDFEQINEWLAEYKLGKVIIESQIITIETDNMSRLRLKMKNKGSYFYSIEERRILELLYIVLSSEIVTINKIQEFFDVSKNTILTDIKELKIVLSKQNITIVSTIKMGYVLQGEEFAIRKFLGNYINRLENFQPRDILRRWMQDSLCKMTGEEYDYREIARCLIKQYEQDESIALVSENEEFECNMILLSWIRSMEGYAVVLNAEEKATLVVTKPYQSLRKSFEKLREYHLEIPETEVYYIATLLLGIKIARFFSQDQEDLYIYRFTASLIKNFERIACITFENRERLATRLRGHIRPLYYRLKYGMQTTNPLVKDVMRMYPEVYDFTKRAVRAMPDQLATSLTEDEIAYLTVYLISDEKNQVIAENSNVAKILVLCAAGMATSVLVKEQLQELLGDIAEVEIGIVSKMKKYNLDNYTLIVSTSFLEELNKYKHVLYANVVLSEKDKERIIHLLNQYGVVNHYDRLIHKIMDAAEKSTNGCIRRNEMYFEVLRLLYESRNQKQGRKYSSFIQVLQEKQFHVLKPEEGTRELLLYGCLLVTKEENTGKRLYERLGNMIRKHKLKYYEIEEDVILIHCPMQGEKTGEIGYGVVTSNERIAIPDCIEGKVFVFCTTIDQNAHFHMLKSLYDAANSEEGKVLLYQLKGGI